ncbi:MAG: RNA-dependent RNA polymerase [Hangzhou rhabdovirus 1]|nr:MAG: RNA-dependent RNA polymerase [Hangzhou rhabdovirus 1]
MNDETYDFDDPVAPEPGPAPTHCNVPLKTTNARAALRKPAPGQYIYNMSANVREWMAIREIAGEVEPNRFNLTSVQYDILNAGLFSLTTDQSVQWAQQRRVGKNVNFLNACAVSRTCSEPLRIPAELSTRDVEFLTPYYATRVWLEEGVMLSGSPNSRPVQWKKNISGVSYHDSPSLSVYITSNLCLIVMQSRTCLVSRDHFLILSDLASQRYIILHTLLLERGYHERSLPGCDFFKSVIENGDMILRESGDPGYNLIKTWEQECQAMLVGDIPVGEPTGKKFEDIILSESSKLAIKLGVHELYLERRRLLELLRQNPSQISEAFGLYRIWGHPTVDPLAGASALKKIATQVRGFDAHASMEVTLKFKEEFIKRYIAKEHKWPKLDTTRLSPHNIIRISYESGSLFPNHHPSYNRRHLYLVDFEQTFPVDPKFDLIEMIADKSMSLTTDNLLSHLRRKAGVGTAQERSVLLAWLKSDKHDPELFLKEIDQHGFPANEKSIGVKEKERELKEAARLFGLMTFSKRMYIVLTEALLAEHILVYFPEITMVDDEISLDKKRRLFTSSKWDGHRLFTCIDFQKWNSYMRELETKGIFKCFDNLFGFSNLYQRTHEMFNDSHIYLLNGSYMPTLSGGSLKTDIGCWTGHLGGIEGLRQKGWTLWTVSLLLYISEDISVRLSIMGQGDNQVLREIYPESFDEPRMMTEHFKLIKSLNDFLLKVGPPLKLEETWTSRFLFVYGKYTIYKSVSLPMSLKRIARIFRLSNEDYPTLESTISSQTANLSAAVGSRNSVGPCFQVYANELVGTLQLFFTSPYLLSLAPLLTFSKESIYLESGTKGRKVIEVRPLLRSSIIQEDIIYESLLVFPRALGGYPVANLFNLLMRGFPDDVSFAIASLKLMWIEAKDSLKRRIEYMLNPGIAETKNFALLFEQPTALNLDSPPAPGESRRNKVVEFLKTTTSITNPYFKTFMGLLDSDEETQIVDFLAQARPFNPRVLSLIASATTGARARHLAGKLQKTPTIGKIARESGGCDINQLVRGAEERQLSHILQRVQGFRKGPRSWSYSECSVAVAARLREASWGSPIVGVDCVPPQEFIYIELNPQLDSCKSDLELDKGMIIMRMQQGISPIDWSNPHILGSHRPYRGSVTRQKVRGYGDQLAEQADPFLKKALRTASLIGWAIPQQGNLALLIHLLISSKTDLAPSLLVPDQVNSSGTAHHRLQDERTDHGGAVALLPNMGTRFTFDTFPLSAYSKGSSNVNLMFQALLSFSTAIVGQVSLEGWVPTIPNSHVHVKKSCCIRDVDETLIDCPEVPRFAIKSHPDNIYLYIPKERVLREKRVLDLHDITGEASRHDEIRRHQYEWLLTEEILHILKPLTWGWGQAEITSHSLPINWTLKISLQSLMEKLSLRLIASYACTGSIMEFKEFLLVVSTRIENSPLHHWAQLENLVFAPQLHHELVAAPYRARISGDPCLSASNLGANLRELSSAIIRTRAGSLSLASRCRVENAVSSPRCKTAQHPATLWLLVSSLEAASSAFFTYRPILAKLIVLELTPSSNVPDPVLKAFDFGRSRILGETPDSLCKTIVWGTDVVHSMSSPVSDVPSAAIDLFKFSQNQLERGECHFSPLMSQTSKTYEAFATKLVSKPTSGSYKCISVVKYSQCIPRNALLLGDGSGGFTFGLLRLFPQVKVYYNSLITKDEGIQQAPPIPYIPALAGHPDLETRCLGLNWVNNELSDFTHPLYPQMLLNHGMKRITLLMCDAESKEFLKKSESLEMIVRLVQIIRVIKPEWSIVKTYLANPSSVQIVISLLLSVYETVEVVRSEFSTFGNTEVYLVCRQISFEEPPVLTSLLLSGKVLGHWSLEILNKMAMAVRGSSSIPSSDTALAYARIIESDLEEYFQRQVESFFPFLLFEPELTYPHSILDMIRRTTILRINDDPIPLNSLKQLKISRSTVKKWTMNWIALALIALPEGTVDIAQIHAKGYSVLYQLASGEYEFSLSPMAHPDWRLFDTGRYWRLSRLLSSGDLKIIHRLIGIFRHLRPDVNYLSKDITRGGITRHGGPLSQYTKAKDKWIHKTLQNKNMEAPQVQPKILRLPKLQRSWRTKNITRNQ